MELYSDIYYVERVLAGETGCFACLIDRYSDPVYNLIVQVVRNREDAQELTQDVFMKVFRKLSTFKSESRFSTWLYRIAYNTAISETRRRKMEYLAFDELQLTNAPDPEMSDWLSEVDNHERLDRLDRAMEQLPADERILILLFYMEGHSVEQLTEITALTTSNVKTKLHRIRKKLYLLMTKMEER
ncbi:sigma-70 family RNA polymerase sigma factor [Parabacteroides sp. OttesenSCG-928-N08]|nr:sigma-70 family RNA polymerase sigma factor [Parabacteroides sp. OttesenSCG-928-N08]